MNADLHIFVDREESAEFCFGMAQAGLGRNLIAIQGENGIGKSALLEELERRCRAAGILCARLDFVSRGEYNSYPNFLSALTDLWSQLRLGTFDELLQLVNIPHTGNGAAAAATAVPAASRLPLQVTGTINAPSEGAQAAIGSNIIQVQGQLTQVIQQSDARISEPLIRANITHAFQERLQRLTQQQQVVILLDSWEAILTGHDFLKDPGAWICDELLSLLVAGDIPNCVALLATAAEPALGDLMRQVRRVPLGPLAPAAVIDYFRQAITVPLADAALQQLVEISQGVPLAMHLLADGVNVQRGPGAMPDPPALDTSGAHVVIGFAVDRYLESLPVSAVEAVRIGAIPHRLNGALLAKLGVTPADVDAIRQCSFVLHSADRESFTYHPAVREHLLAWWDANDSGRCRDLNRLALDYFGGQAAARQAAGQQAFEYEREFLYHQLIENEAAGFEWLATKCEDAADQFALDHAAGFIEQAAELDRRGELTPPGCLWLDYFRARLNLLKSLGDRGEATFARLAETPTTDSGSTESGNAKAGPDEFLQCLARWNLGNVKVEQNHWSDAVRSYRTALAGLQRLKLQGFVVRVMLALGNAYRSFAGASGEVTENDLRATPVAGSVLYFLRDLPFTAYVGLARRVRFLPTLYFGTQYPNWIAAYLLTEGAGWYRRAEAEQKKSGGPAQVETQLLLADTEHRLGRWSQAQHRYALLTQTMAAAPANSAEQATASGTTISTTNRAAQYNYRQAQVALGQGRLLLDERKLEAAEGSLQDALRAFVFFADSRSVGAAGELLGRVYTRQHQSQQAVAAYRQSLDAYTAVSDHLAATRAACLLQNLAVRPGLDAQTAAEAQSAAAQLKQRQYLVRFPDSLLRWFRRLAVLGAIPLTYFLTLLFAAALLLTLWITEGEIVLAIKGWNAGTAIGDIALLASAAILPIFLIVWFYQLTYTLLGMAIVYFLGRRLSPIEKAQPAIITCTDQSLTCEYPRNGQQTTTPWVEAAGFFTLHYCLRRRPLELFSGALLTAQAGPGLILEAVTSGYSHLLRDVEDCLQAARPELPKISRDFVIFDRRWELASTIIVGLLTAYLLFTGLRVDYEIVAPGMPLLEMGPGAQPAAAPRSILLWLTSAAIAFLPTWLFLGAAVILWRLTFHQWRVVRLHRRSYPTLPVWTFALVALLLSLLVVLWLLLLYLFSAAGNAS